MNLEKQRAFIIHTVFIVMVAGILYVFFKYLFPVVVPFALGFFISFFLRTWVNRLCAHTPLGHRAASLLVILLFYGLLFLGVITAGAHFSTQIAEKTAHLPAWYKDNFLPGVTAASDDFLARFPQFTAVFQQLGENLNEMLFSFISSFSSGLIQIASSVFGQIPDLLIGFFFMIISSYFFTLDYRPLKNTVFTQLPASRHEVFFLVYREFFTTALHIGKAYFTLILITFAELLIGFLIIGLPHPILYAALTALVDIFPVLGTGTVLLPWALIAFLGGEKMTALGLLLLYLIISVIRQTIEPKIVGRQLDLHPLLTLVCMYIGTSLFGIAGFFLLPFLVAVMKNIKDKNIFSF